MKSDRALQLITQLMSVLLQLKVMFERVLSAHVTYASAHLATNVCARSGGGGGGRRRRRRAISLLFLSDSSLLLLLWLWSLILASGLCWRYKWEFYMHQKSMVELQRYFLVLQTIGESTTVNVYELGRVVEALQKIKTNPAVISPGNIR